MKRILISSVFTLFTLISFSQGYGTIDYMGKKIKVSTEFFKSLNEEYNRSQDGISLKVYYALVDFLKKPATIIIVDEAKRISWQKGSATDYPYGTGDKASKRDRNDSSMLVYRVLLPVIERYAD